jgi:Protein of unknown function (DUF5674)
MDTDASRIVSTQIALADIVELARHGFGDMVKAAVDIQRGIMAIGGQLHADEEALLLQNGSVQGDIWGINIYPGESDTNWIEFDSMINLRPARGNRSRGVDDESLQARIRQVVESLVVR